MRSSAKAVTIEKRDYFIELAGGEADRRVGGAIIEPQRLPVLLENPAAGKDNLGCIAGALIMRLRLRERCRMSPSIPIVDPWKSILLGCDW